MSNGIFSTAIKNAIAVHTETKTEGYTMVNVRPGEKVSAMLDVISHLHQKSPSMIIIDELSKKLAEYAVSSVDHAQPVLNALERLVQEEQSHNINASSALGILKEQKFFVINTFNPFLINFELTE